MKPVLGVLLLLVGFTLAYIVLANKLPSGSNNPPQGDDGSTTPHKQGRLMSGGYDNPLGIPTMSNMDVLSASRGFTS